MNSSKFASKRTLINLLQIYDNCVKIATKILASFGRILWSSVFSAHKIYKIILTLQVKIRNMTSGFIIFFNLKSQKSSTFKIIFYEYVNETKMLSLH